VSVKSIDGHEENSRPEPNGRHRMSDTIKIEEWELVKKQEIELNISMLLTQARMVGKFTFKYGGRVYEITCKEEE
jgi:hypothetical protein